MLLYERVWVGVAAARPTLRETTRALAACSTARPTPAGRTTTTTPTLAPVAEGAPGQEALRRRATGGGAARPNARARARGRR